MWTSVGRRGNSCGAGSTSLPLVSMCGGLMGWRGLVESAKAGLRRLRAVIQMSSAASRVRCFFMVGVLFQAACEMGRLVMCVGDKAA